MTQKKDSKNGSRMIERLLSKVEVHRLLSRKNSCVLISRFYCKGERWGIFGRARRLRKDE